MNLKRIILVAPLAIGCAQEKPQVADYNSIIADHNQESYKWTDEEVRTIFENDLPSMIEETEATLREFDPATTEYGVNCYDKNNPSLELNYLTVQSEKPRVHMSTSGNHRLEVSTDNDMSEAFLLYTIIKDSNIENKLDFFNRYEGMDHEEIGIDLESYDLEGINYEAQSVLDAIPKIDNLNCRDVIYMGLDESHDGIYTNR
ncbi:hypothetical protein HN385_04765 [archaeon]|jgi:hypothetical protein|nr:hypothetical protein [archaeon]MBT3451050.1 hypothetical protein [archaeon]MBT6869140.1 hypothetical protein [archaeon]MBT7192787.1 hypothetical protein [archaeon]MBT7381327.1 hypothetical protein [archaeon]